ncbi:MAG: hypothetical protein COA42_13405 [Alteromonadaceae bacterium]|nr:MAG: hypothetical protein COA42_13405 [Alteromonadaceae bacterium]
MKKTLALTLIVFAMLGVKAYAATTLLLPPYLDTNNNLMVRNTSNSNWQHFESNVKKFYRQMSPSERIFYIKDNGSDTLYYWNGSSKTKMIDNAYKIDFDSNRAIVLKTDGDVVVFSNFDSSPSNYKTIADLGSTSNADIAVNANYAVTVGGDRALRIYSFSENITGIWNTNYNMFRGLDLGSSNIGLIDMYHKLWVAPASWVWAFASGAYATGNPLRSGINYVSDISMEGSRYAYIDKNTATAKAKNGNNAIVSLGSQAASSVQLTSEGVAWSHYATDNLYIQKTNSTFSVYDSSRDFSASSVFSYNTVDYDGIAIRTNSSNLHIKDIDISTSLIPSHLWGQIRSIGEWPGVER